MFLLHSYPDYFTLKQVRSNGDNNAIKKWVFIQRDKWNLKKNEHTNYFLGKIYIFSINVL